MLFQADRLANRARADTTQENAHLTDLEQGYRDSAKHVRILLRYHMGRVTRGNTPLPQDAIDAQGNARPHVTD